MFANIRFFSIIEHKLIYADPERFFEIVNINWLIGLINISYLVIVHSIYKISKKIFLALIGMCIYSIKWYRTCLILKYEIEATTRSNPSSIETDL